MPRTPDPDGYTETGRFDRAALNAFEGKPHLLWVYICARRIEKFVQRRLEKADRAKSFVPRRKTDLINQLLFAVTVYLLCKEAGIDLSAITALLKLAMG